MVTSVLKIWHGRDNKEGDSERLHEITSASRCIVATLSTDHIPIIYLANRTLVKQKEIVAGSSNGRIRVIRRCEIIAEVSEGDGVVGLCTLNGGRRFAYLLTNGSVGVYERTTRLWRIRTKHSASCIQQFDITGDGKSEVVIGCRNGKVRGDQNKEWIS